MPNSEMDYNGNRQQRRNEILIGHRQALPGQSAYMSFKNHGSAGYHSNAGLRHRTPSDHQLHHHPHKLKILESMSHCTASTASLSDSEFGGDSTDSCRIHHASAGESKSYLSLEPISYASTSLAEDDYWRLNNSSVNEDKSLGTASTTMSAPTYYRPVDSFGETISSVVSTTSSRLPPRAVSARTICSHLDEMSAVTFSYSLSEDGHESNPHTIQHKQTTRSPQRKIEKTICWTDDDSELKRMESITHSFQRSSSMASRNHKISAPPLSGIGVEICRSTSYQHDHIPTPREAANVSCSLSSIVGELLGVAQPKGDLNSSRKGLFSGFVSSLFRTKVYNSISSLINLDTCAASENYAL